MDVTDADAVAATIGATRPAAIAHLAYRPGDERAIVGGSANVAAAASRIGARLVHLSTDVVFAGRADAYTEADTPDPLSEYGRMKRDAEQVVLAHSPAAVCVRTSLMYGTAVLGACQRDVLRALDDPAAPTFFTDEIRCFTLVDDVARAVTALAADDRVSGPLHVASNQSLDRYAFACRTAAWLGHSPAALRAGTQAQSGLIRPARVVLDSALAAASGIRCRTFDDVLAAAAPPTVPEFPAG